MRIAGVGVWARGFANLSDVVDRSEDRAASEQAYAAPVPEAIPARERRRAGPYISLAVEVAHQACDMAGVDKTTIPSVFTSAMGDTQITSYMCRKLTQVDKLLSPTQFHNSVHNAPSGYWTISTGNREPSTFIGGFDKSFGAGLIEAASQVLAFAQPVLLVCYDSPTEAPFRDVLRIDEPLGIALVLAPADWQSVSPQALCLFADLQVAASASMATAVAGVGAGLATLLRGAAMPEAVALLDAIAGLVRGASAGYRAAVAVPGGGVLQICLGHDVSRVAQ